MIRTGFRPLVVFLVLFVLFPLSGCERKKRDIDLSMYLYRDTKDLVRFVYDASKILEKKGMTAIEEFRQNISQYRTPDYYLYVYSMDATNLFHAGIPEMEGQNLMNIRDKNGKYISKLILNAIDNPVNPHGWVHYTWVEPGKFYPVPKSSCHFKVTASDGNQFFIGGGIDYPHDEKEFIRIVVDDAVNRIENEGKQAIAAIADPVSQYNYRNERVFVFYENGTILVSPATSDYFQLTSIIDCVDEGGHKPFRKALERLKEREYTWEVFLSKSRYQRGLIKKSLYLRKAQLSGKTVYVGAVTDLPQPP